jgi:DNA-binding NtrC family response regulator
VNGLDLAEWATRTHPEIRIVLTSGYAQPEGVNDRSRLEHYAFVHKPYRLADLARALRNAVNR